MPVWVDVRKACARELEVSGTISLQRLPRFRDYLASHSADITVHLGFATDRDGQRLIRGELSARIEMTCQRCLQPLTRELQEPIRLALSGSDAESRLVSLDSPWDPWICTEDKLQLAELVEEQLILALPIVGLHDDTGCIDRLQYDNQPDHPDTEPACGPFAVLGKLKHSTLEITHGRATKQGKSFEA